MSAQTAPEFGQVDTLRRLLHGQNAPLTAQYTWAMLHLLPADVARHPGSSDFRHAQRHFWEGRGILLDATRRDVEQGIAFLDRCGALRLLKAGDER